MSSRVVFVRLRWMSVLGLSVCLASAQAQSPTFVMAPMADLASITQAVLHHNPTYQAALQAERQALAGIITAQALPNP
ncbi:MAG: hypothetical protein QM527_03775 [Alphaproteobacteria bacterium]|nr:hypothetical protein [Alphaproteobacteria bacterium]